MAIIIFKLSLRLPSLVQEFQSQLACYRRWMAGGSYCRLPHTQTKPRVLAKHSAGHDEMTMDLSCLIKLNAIRLLSVQLLQVVYLSDSAGYIPVTPIRSSRHPQSQQQPPPSQVSADYQAASSATSYGAPGVDLEQWRPELWDRDYSRRYRHNNTRVQRKWLAN